MIPTQAQYTESIRKTKQHLTKLGALPLSKVLAPPPDLDPGSRAQFASLGYMGTSAHYYISNAAARQLHEKWRPRGQRDVNVKHVERLQSLLERGKWQCTCVDSFTFTWTNPEFVADGGNRMAAIARSGFGVIAEVRMGADPDALLDQLNKNRDTVPQALGRLALELPEFVEAVPVYRHRDRIVSVTRVHMDAFLPRTGERRSRIIPASEFASIIVANLPWLAQNVGPLPDTGICGGPVVRYAMARAADDSRFVREDVLLAARALISGKTTKASPYRLFSDMHARAMKVLVRPTG